MKNTNLPATTEAIAELSSALAYLNEVMGDKQKEISLSKKKAETELKSKDKKIENLKSAYTKIINNVDSVINRLDKVLEKDGSGNNNN